jgi:hypothetical protein
MKIARHWIKGRAEALLESGETITVGSWGWSEASREEALQRAAQAARRAARRIEAGEPLPHGYGYSDRPPREEIIEELKRDAEETHAVITRNSYGCLVLNTDELMFIDVDIPPESSSAALVRRIKSLFGGEADSPETRIRKKVAEVAALNSDYTIRLYRTYAGFRCAVVNKTIAPGSTESRRLLDAFGADPLYVKLCHNQQSYRARLTPKYWRCGAHRPPARFPWETKEQEQRYRNWERQYAELTRGFATCRLITQFGTREGDASLMSLIDLHDRFTKAYTELKLA